MTIATKKGRLFSRADVNREQFIDELRQRWLVERAAVTLYELALSKLGDDATVDGVVPHLMHFRDQERLHADMLASLLGELGRDPRHEPATPEVNIGASEMATLLELMRGDELEPHHRLEVLLLAERFDGFGWELLTDAAKEAGLDEEWLRSFRAASREEAEHQHLLHAWVWRSLHNRLCADART